MGIDVWEQFHNCHSERSEESQIKSEMPQQQK
jgi:hypothetical protein